MYLQDPISVAAPTVAMPINHHHHVGGFPFFHPNMSASTNSTSSTSSDDEPPEGEGIGSGSGRISLEGWWRRWSINKGLQSKFLDTLERRERDRMTREEAWRIQEMAKMKREHDLLVQERSMVAAKDAASSPSCRKSPSKTQKLQFHKYQLFHSHRHRHRHRHHHVHIKFKQWLLLSTSTNISLNFQVETGVGRLSRVKKWFFVQAHGQLKGFQG